MIRYCLLYRLWGETKAMNVFLYSWNCNSEEDFCESLNNLGYKYTKFAYPIKDYEADSEFLEKCIGEIRKASYDCIFSFDYFPLLSDAAEKEGILYFSWVYDCPHYTLYSEKLYNKCNRIFFFDRVQYLEFKQRGLDNGFYLPLAVNVNRLDKLLGEAVRCVDYEHDISFVGSLYNNNLYKSFPKLPEYVKGYLEGIIAAQSQVYGYNFIYEMMTDDLIKLLNKMISCDDSSAIVIPDRLLYSDIINTRITELDRIGILNMLAEYASVDLYTNSDTAALKGVNVLGTVDYRKEMPVVFRKSKINLNMSLRSITSGIPLRAMDILGSGGFLISNYQPEFAEYFDIGKEIVLYESMSDLKDKALYYLTHDEERVEIAAAGYRKVKECFSYENIIEMLFESIL